MARIAIVGGGPGGLMTGSTRVTDTPPELPIGAWNAVG